MNEVDFIAGSGRDLFTQSRLRAFRKCPRYHYLRFEVGIVQEESKKALRMGSAFHLGQEELAKVTPYVPGDRANEELRQSEIEAAILAAMVDYNEAPPQGVDHLEWAVERETVGRLLQGYVWRWQEEDIQIVVAEHKFRQPVINYNTKTPMFKVIPSQAGPPRQVPFYRAGMIDKIVSMPDGRIAILEHKTTGDSIKSDSDYWKQAKMSSQVSFYFQAACDDPALPSPDTIFYDVIHKPQIAPRLITKGDTNAFLGLSFKKGKKTVVQPDPEVISRYSGEEFVVEIRGEIDNETAEHAIEEVVVDGCIVEFHTDGRMRETPTMFGARLMQDMINRPNTYFAREEISRLQNDLEEFNADVYQTVEMIRFCQSSNQWPKNTDMCIYPFRCEYFQVCASNVRITVGGDVPQGYVRLDNVNPELQER